MVSLHNQTLSLSLAFYPTTGVLFKPLGAIITERVCVIATGELSIKYEPSPVFFFTGEIQSLLAMSCY